MSILMYPLATEKAINMVDRNNTITYIIVLNATKQQVKKEFEERFAVKVKKVNISISDNNTKKAYVTLDKAYKASDLALKLKLL
ncbi:MAG: 50S ribosomal protein L23 [Candidatus Micrarchaeaceae archaeon]